MRDLQWGNSPPAFMPRFSGVGQQPTNHNIVYYIMAERPTVGQHVHPTGIYAEVLFSRANACILPATNRYTHVCSHHSAVLCMHRFVHVCCHMTSSSPVASHIPPGRYPERIELRSFRYSCTGFESICPCASHVAETYANNSKKELNA